MLMKNNRNQSLDGFFTRHHKTALGEAKKSDATINSNARNTKKSSESTEINNKNRSSYLINSIDKLSPITVERDPDTPKPKKKSRLAKFIVRFLLLALLAAISLGGYYALRMISASGKIFNGNIVDLFSKAELKRDENNRTNILIFGTSEDGDNGTHPGGHLTDSIMVASYSHETKAVSFVSLPRDLWVKLDEACSVGYYERINTVYMCGSDNGENESVGANALAKKVTEITGLAINYYVHVNFGAVEKLVDAVGGLQVMIESDDPRGIADQGFAYPNGLTPVLNGHEVLDLTRARNAYVGYGIPSNFEREKNQQRALQALIKKIMSSESLYNINRISTILETLGDNLKTDITMSEVRSAIDLGKQIDLENGEKLGFQDSGNAVVKSANIGGRSVLVPVAGEFNYSGIRSFIAKELNSEAYVKEEAVVGVYNASGIEGLARLKATEIEQKGFTVGEISNAPEQVWPSDIVIYQLNPEKPETGKKLSTIYNQGITKSTPSFNYDLTMDYLIVFTAE